MLHVFASPAALCAPTHRDCRGIDLAGLAQAHLGRADSGPEVALELREAMHRRKHIWCEACIVHGQDRTAGPCQAQAGSKATGSPIHQITESTNQVPSSEKSDRGL
jgi:hypothetical protein